MGLYDYIRCEAKLPGNPPAFVTAETMFQTKDLDEGMDTYVIRSDGSLIHAHTETPQGEFTGNIEFYISTASGCHLGYSFTANGEDAIWVCYKATFHEGLMVSIVEESQTRTHGVRPLPVELPNTEDIQAIRRREAESLLGRTIVVWRGGESSEPYEAVVVAESERSIVVRSDGSLLCGEEFEVIHRSSRDCTFFDSLADGREYKARRKAEMETQRAHYAAQVAAKTS